MIIKFARPKRGAAMSREKLNNKKKKSNSITFFYVKW